ncbi:AAA family ATPase [Arthrobacter cavernae]|uniref:Nuclease SbcCD subunit C n=1 Tax=Arthrobacter cavernae TaxID=2817681 RepID=A0A939HFJ6_9MICC|nr:SMC family ATPase [Arthrobacter cavernae]MBO1266966.1 SMC family ATPase [Arthrobacter cavernae]
MRIHRLEIEAFGPFSGVQEIDFDQLGAQGLFLLNGATGAGKTSILDAICFALYGSVPGARQDGKRLRSDHAAPAAEPRVVCEFSARGRRFEVTRSPAWERPTARGKNGFTTQQAKTLLRERVGGAWIDKSSRNDEAGAELSDVLGMDREQFTRVVMLPQGDFAAFLRSKAGERLDLLQKLFGTQRFEAIEQQLSRQATAARSTVDGNNAGLGLLLDRAKTEYAQLGLALPLPAAGHDAAGASDTAATEAAHAAAMPGGSPGPEEPEALLERLEQEAQAEWERRQDEARAAESSRLQLADILHCAQERAQRHSRLATATLRRESLEAGAASAEEERDRLGRHRRAAVLGGHLDAVDAAAQAVEASSSRAAGALTRLEEASLDAGQPAAALEAATAACAVLLARVPEEQKLEDIAGQLLKLRKESADRQAASEEAGARLAGLRDDESALLAAMEPLDSVAATLAEQERGLAAAEALVDAIAKHESAVSVLGEATEQHGLAKAESLDLRQAWLDLRESRLSNAAAELAAELEGGQDCPVCGSAEHPSPAQGARSALAIAQEEESARSRFEESERKLDRLAAELSAAAQTVAGLAVQGGAADAQAAEAAAADALSSLETARAAAGTLAKLRQEHLLLQDAVARLEQEQLHARTDAVRSAADATSLHKQHAELEDTLAGLREGFPSLRERIESLSTQRQLLQAAVGAASQLERAVETLDDAEKALQKALPAAGFDSADAARAELLAPMDVLLLEDAVEAFTAERARVDELFAGEDLVLAAKELRVGDLALSAAELSDLQKAAEAGEATTRALELSAGLAGKSVAALRRIRVEYLDLSAAGRGPREHARLLGELADTARGFGDNSYRMSLNSYVLAARLEQVALAASERLVAMSDGRYTLQHSDAKAARGAKSGLGLEVVDEWTGQRRDTSTLSGGESFMASLSLALGLADVVQQEAGGVDIETLFVDEGFGSLDEQALEQVMDALESLRDGGRVVGLVSHVSEMKQRIGSQLQVIKGRNGSTVRIAKTALG